MQAWRRAVACMYLKAITDKKGCHPKALHGFIHAYKYLLNLHCRAGIYYSPESCYRH